MISGVFVDRPRLAIVIAIITSIAGFLALRIIPVSQFPDIVPPQVQVTTRFPGASASVVESTIGQPLEAQVNGVDQMLYMKSNSGNDGSYGLTVSFALGTNPDINTVNVNNRVQAALSRLPAEVQRNGVTVQKRSSAILEFLAFSSEGAKQDPLFISNYVTINVLDRLSRVQGVGSASLFGALDYSMRIWFDTNRMIELNLAPSDIIDGDPAAERAGARWPRRCPPDQRRDAVPTEPADERAPGGPQGLRGHRGAGQPRRLGPEGPRRGTDRARGGEPGQREPAER